MVPFQDIRRRARTVKVCLVPWDSPVSGKTGNSRTALLAWQAIQTLDSAAAPLETAAYRRHQGCPVPFVSALGSTAICAPVSCLVVLTNPGQTLAKTMLDAGENCRIQLTAVGEFCLVRRTFKIRNRADRTVGLR